jgi:membrane protein YdbS with pleckstrin-like domain
MYCRKCGQEMQNDSNFCGNCGGATGEAPRVAIHESNIPALALKPVFIPWAVMLAILPVHIFMTIWGGGFFGGFSMFAVKAIGLDVPEWSTFLFFGALFFFAIPLVAYTAQKKSYAKTEYRFYQTKLDYYEGFFTTEEKTIDYKNVTEVNLVKGIIQKKYGLGTIVLSTPATGFASGRARSGIRVQDIPNADQVYQQIKGLVQRATSARVA